MRTHRGDVTTRGDFLDHLLDDVTVTGSRITGIALNVVGGADGDYFNRPIRWCLETPML